MCPAGASGGSKMWRYVVQWCPFRWAVSRWGLAMEVLVGPEACALNLSNPPRPKHHHGPPLLSGLWILLVDRHHQHRLKTQMQDIQAAEVYRTLYPPDLKHQIALHLGDLTHWSRGGFFWMTWIMRAHPRNMFALFISTKTELCFASIRTCP